MYIGYIYWTYAWFIHRILQANLVQHSNGIVPPLLLGGGGCPLHPHMITHNFLRPLYPFEISTPPPKKKTNKKKQTKKKNPNPLLKCNSSAF